MTTRLATQTPGATAPPPPTTRFRRPRRPPITVGMPSAFGSGPAADPRLGLGLLGILLVFALALLAVWRRDALRNAGDPARQAWFGFAIRVHLLLLAGWLIGPAITAMARPALGLSALVPTLTPLAPLLGLVLLGALPLGLTLAAVIVAGDVERRLRASGLTLRERLSNTALTLGVALLPLGGLVAANAMLVSGNYRAAVGCALAGFVAALWLGGRRAAVLGLRPEAETSGPLRDRLFELAARARVRVPGLRARGVARQDGERVCSARRKRPAHRPPAGAAVAPRSRGGDRA